jgi:hypothetical protein
LPKCVIELDGQSLLAHLLLLIAYCLFFEIITIVSIQPKTIFIPLGCGFLLLVPWSYIEADERREKRGEIDPIFISHCGKFLFLGVFYIYMFFTI